MGKGAAQAIVEAEERASTSAWRLKQAAEHMTRLQWRDSAQGRIMCAVRRAIECGDMDALGKALAVLEETLADDEFDHDALETHLLSTSGDLAAVARDLGPLAGALEDGRYHDGLAPVTILTEAI